MTNRTEIERVGGHLLIGAHAVRFDVPAIERGLASIHEAAGVVR